MSETRGTGIPLKRVQPIHRGTHDATKAYETLDIVVNASNTAAYMAVQDVPVGTALTDANYWEAIVNVSGVVDNVNSAVNANKEELQNNIDTNKKETDEAISQISEGIDNLSVESVNLFNKDDVLILNDSYVAYEGYRSLSGCVVTHPIKVKKGVTYKYPHDRILGTNYNFAICDADGNFIRSREGTIDNNNFIHFTVNEDCYVRVNVGNKGTDNFMLCVEDEYPAEYIPYSQKLNENFVLNEKQKKEVVSMTNPLLGKIVTFNGDSICYGAGSIGGYGKIIAEKNKMVYENVGVSGGTIKAETYDSSGKAKHWICRTIANMRNDADYIILEGGVNDGKGNLGTLSDGYSAELDDTTFYGAFESMLKQALERWPGKKIGYIFAHKCTESFSSNGDTANPYHAAMKCLKKWGIPFVDLNTECPPLNFVPSLKATYTNNGDGWHPNEEGYKKYYVPKIEAWMRSL